MEIWRLFTVSGTARRAYEEIAWHFQRSETGGVFDDNPLITAEKVNWIELFSYIFIVDIS